MGSKSSKSKSINQHEKSDQVNNTEDKITHNLKADVLADNVNDSLKDQLYGDETEVSEGAEADLHKNFVACKKNPGHTQFIPVDTFTLNHLPEGHRDMILYEYIKLAADLTVRVDVKKISPDRPQFWPNTSIPYPFYNMRGKTKLRYGTGIVSRVFKFTDENTKHKRKPKHKYIYDDDFTKCCCTRCQDPKTASPEWWEFYVYTATHVVFDDIEASHTTLRLFYDNEESQCIIFDQVIDVEVKNERDWCELKCVTCDRNLGEKLNMLEKTFLNTWWVVNEKYKKSRDEVKMNFIVSHPHGCCKQVSVGNWLDKYEVSQLCYKFTYTTCTCPGSSGATVHCLGYECVGWIYELVHSGSFNNELNFSGGGYVV